MHTHTIIDFDSLQKRKPNVCIYINWIVRFVLRLTSLSWNTRRVYHARVQFFFPWMPTIMLMTILAVDHGVDHTP